MRLNMILVLATMVACSSNPDDTECVPADDVVCDDTDTDVDDTDTDVDDTDVDDTDNE